MLRSKVLSGNAKQHFFLDACMSDVVEPVDDATVALGSGSKIAVTVGPACQSVETLSEMLLAGLACARIDLTWGSIDFHRTSLRNLAAAMKATKRLCSVWLDTLGREVIVCMPAHNDPSGWLVLEKTPICFKAGQEVVLTTDVTAQACPSLLPISTAKFAQLVAPGQSLHVGRYLASGADGGSLFLNVLSNTDKEIRCVAENDATLTGLLTVAVSHRAFELHSHKEDLNAELPLFTEHDIDCIKTLGKDFEIDFLSLSYCNSPNDVWEARETLDALGLAQTKIIAKVERKAAVHNFEGIVASADGVLLSRGNLGLDFEPEEMALLQKRCIARCNAIGRPIFLTRFVDTMVNTPRPTRAEATDVANVVLDGADGVLLGAETLRGIYPVQTVQTVARLCCAAEKHFDHRKHYEDMMGEAFEEEVALERAFPSSADLERKSPRQALSSLYPSTTMLRRIAAPVGGAPSMDGDDAHLRDMLGSPGTKDSGSPDGGAANLGRKVSSFGVLKRAHGGSSDQLTRMQATGMPYLSKVEAIASSAVRSAEKIHAGLIVVLAQTGRTVSLVAKYRPPMPVLAVVVPTLKSSGLGWKLEGKLLARQCMLMRGVRPMLAAPMVSTGEELLAQTVRAAHKDGLVKPRDFVVTIMTQQKSLVVKVAQVNEDGSGLAKAMMLTREEALQRSKAATRAKGMPRDPFDMPKRGVGIGSAPPPQNFLGRASMSLAGAGTLGADNPGLLRGGLVQTASDAFGGSFRG